MNRYSRAVKKRWTWNEPPYEMFYVCGLMRQCGRSDYNLMLKDTRHYHKLWDNNV